MILISLMLSAIISILAGLIVLAWPKSLNYIVAMWLLFNGIMGLVSLLV